MLKASTIISAITRTIGNIRLRIGNHIAAESRYKRALAIREKALGPDHPDVATIANNLASLYQDMGKYEQALPIYQQAIKIR